MSVMEKRELEALIKDINDDDLKHMFKNDTINASKKRGEKNKTEL